MWRGHDLLHDRTVALKLVGLGSPAAADRFVAEASTLASLTHPALVRFLDAGMADGEAYLVMDLIDGPNLASELAAGAPLDPCRTAKIGASLASALAYVHEHRIVHRDVKPANVLIGSDGIARLADFGVARLMDEVGPTTTGMTIGTAAYMAPEQLEHHSVGPAADVYSLGLVLLECLSGRREYQGTLTEVAARRLCQDPVVPQELPVGWRLLLGAMLVRDPLRRPTPAEVASVLAPFSQTALATDPLLAASTVLLPSLSSSFTASPTLPGPAVSSRPPVQVPRALVDPGGTARGARRAGKDHHSRRLMSLMALAAVLAGGLVALGVSLGTVGNSRMPRRVTGRVSTKARTAPSGSTVQPTTASTAPPSASSPVAALSPHDAAPAGPGGSAGRFLINLQNGLVDGSVSAREASSLISAIACLLEAYDSGQASRAAKCLNQLDASIQQGEERGSLSVALGNTLSSDLQPLVADVGSMASQPGDVSLQGAGPSHGAGPPSQSGPGTPVGINPPGAPPGRERKGG